MMRKYEEHHIPNSCKHILGRFSPVLNVTYSLQRTTSSGNVTTWGSSHDCCSSISTAIKKEMTKDELKEYGRMLQIKYLEQLNAQVEESKNRN